MQEIIMNYSELERKHFGLCEKFESYRLDKEMLSKKLKQVTEMLLQEQLLSQQHLDNLNQAKEESLALQEKLQKEKNLNEETSENVIKEGMNITKIKELLMKTNDLDTVLSATLKKLDMEGCIKKTEEGYLYNNSAITLSLHNESFIVVKIGAGLLPLTDFLINPVFPGQNAHNRYSNSDQNVSIEMKSPLKNASSTNNSSNSIKNTKTPLKDRNFSIGDKRRPFK